MTTYRPLAVPGVYAGKETFFKAEVPLTRTLVLARYTIPGSDEIVGYTRNLARKVLGNPIQEPQNLAEILLMSMPLEIVRRIEEGKYSEVLRECIPDSFTKINSPQVQVLQTKVLALTPSIAATLTRELRTGKEYNYATSREDVIAEGISNEQGRILIPLQHWKLPPHSKMHTLLEERVHESDRLTVMGSYPYVHVREMVEAIYGFFDNGRNSVEPVEDITTDITSQFVFRGLKDISVRAIVNRLPVLFQVLNEVPKEPSPTRPPGKGPDDYGLN